MKAPTGKRPASLDGILFGLLAMSAPVWGGEFKEPQLSKPARIFQEILPLAWQKYPVMQFNVFTEMTEAGRKQISPTPAKPLRYVSSEAKYGQAGWFPMAGEQRPSPGQVESAMKAALAANGYLPTARLDDRPDVLIIFSYGSNSTDPVSKLVGVTTSPMGAAEFAQIVVRDPVLMRDVIERGGLAGGEKFAKGLKAALDQEVRNTDANRRLFGHIHLPVSPEFDGPLQQFMLGENSKLMTHLAEVAFYSCYFVVATAYDVAAFEKGQKVVLWRTKMTVAAQGVTMDEVMSPLIANAGAYLGRETSEAAVIVKRIDRVGHVEVGTPVSVGDPAPVNALSAPALAGL